MDFKLPRVAISRDGNRGILVLDWWGEFYRVQDSFATATLFTVRLRPRAREATLQVRISHALPKFWDQPNQRYRWEDDFETSLPDLTLAMIGEYLDDSPVPEQPDPNLHAGVVWLNDSVFDLLRRDPEEEDARLLRYVGGKIVLGHRLGLDQIRFDRSDAVRWGISVDDLQRVAFQGEGQYWTRDNEGFYRPLPRLLADFRAGALPGHERPSLEQVGSVLDAERYPAAAHHLSKALEYLQGANPDLPNAARESVQAVESLAKVLLSGRHATLGDCVKTLRRDGIISREVARMIESLYAYRNATPGVGHGGTEVPDVPQLDAQLVLDVSAAVIRFLDGLWPTVRSDSDVA